MYGCNDELEVVEGKRCRRKKKDNYIVKLNVCFPSGIYDLDIILYGDKLYKINNIISTLAYQAESNVNMK